MKHWIWVLVAVVLAGCAVAQTTESNDSEPLPAPVKEQGFTPVELENLGPAPELLNEVWLNTEGPLRLADLRGKVVLIDMWTFG